LACPRQQSGEGLPAAPTCSKPRAGDRGVQILWQETMAPRFLLCHWVFNILSLSSTHSQLLSHRFLRLFMVCIELLLQEHTGSVACFVASFSRLCFPFCTPLSSFFSLSLSSLLRQRKESKRNASEMKD